MCYVITCYILQAGVRRGMKLVGISDPIREFEVWDLQVGIMVHQ
jgi:hypothetical protein